MSSLTSLTSLIVALAVSARAAPILPASDTSSIRLWSIFSGHPVVPSDLKLTLVNSSPTAPSAVALALAARSSISVPTSNSDNDPDAQMAAAITGSIVLVAFLCIAGYLIKEWNLRQKSNLDGYLGDPWNSSKGACGSINEPYVDESPPANPPMTNQTSPSANSRRATLPASTEMPISQLPAAAPLGFQAPKIRVPKPSVVPLSGVVPSAGYNADQTGSWGSNKPVETGSP
ncbi:hypothetical protein [Phaffia rhodozyma]|uniref:Uncharacterized protein n=1 Tax=Phaffia rhodozyma TaxID=264483 RepID=A0A0F7SU90_PHARH|nr:hypothetical protein [Phaffia rhodozyma]